MNTIVILQNPYLFMEMMFKTMTMRLYATLLVRLRETFYAKPGTFLNANG